MMTDCIASDDHSLKELLQGIHEIDVNSDRCIHGLQLDSREVQKGDVFVACKGTAEHGIRYLDDALNNQCAAVLMEVSVGSNTQAESETAAVLSELSSARAAQLAVPIIAIPDLGDRLADLAKRFYGDASARLNMVGITGTNGKTSCAHYVAQGLATLERTGIIGTLGNGLVGQLSDTRHTTPDLFTLYKLLRDFESAGARHVVMEVSSHGIDQGRVAGIEFDVALFTNLTQDHLDYHGSMENYANVKQRLFENEDLRVAVINSDDSFGQKLATLPQLQGKSILYSLNHRPKGDTCLYAKHVEYGAHGLHLELAGSWGEFGVSSPLLGAFNASNLLGVIAVLLEQGMQVKQIASVVEKMSGVAGRMQIVKSAADDPTVVIDYAHTPDALEKALQALQAHLKTQSESAGELICVFGCGGDRDPIKRPLMGGIAQQWADRIVICDDNPRTEDAIGIVNDILAGVNTVDTEVSVIHDRYRAITETIMTANAGDFILVAGKGHEDYQVIGREKRAYPSDASIAASALQRRNGHADSGDTV